MCMNNHSPNLRAFLTSLALVFTIFFAFAPLTAYSQTTPDSAAAHNCRFWGIVSTHAPDGAIIDQLLSLPFSLDSLSHYNPNGWGIAYFPDTGGGDPIIYRGLLPAYYDPLFDSAAVWAAAAAPQVAVAHIRNCSSGLCNIPNPHPFDRIINGRRWLFGHNGTIDKSVLLKLIRPDFLAAHPPQYGSSESEWIDTDLYFIFFMQAMEDHGGQVKPALGEVIQKLRQETTGIFKQFNFFLTDGFSLWAYCEGNTLYYTHQSQDSSYSAVASQPPAAIPDDWISMSDGQLVTLRPDTLPLVEDIETYFDFTSVDDGPAIGSQPDLFVLNQNFPNPFNSSTRISFTISTASDITLAIFNILGQKISTLFTGRLVSGAHSFNWDGIDDSSRPLASGIYFYRLQTNANAAFKQMILLK